MAVTTERRSVVRHKCFMHGVVYFNHRNSTADCLVRDFTDIGARLRFETPVTLPAAFELHMPGKEMMFQAQVIWLKGNDMGVSLTTPETRHPAAVAAAESAPVTDSISERLARLEHQYAALKRRMDVLQGE